MKCDAMSVEMQGQLTWRMRSLLRSLSSKEAMLFLKWKTVFCSSKQKTTLTQGSSFVRLVKLFFHFLKATLNEGLASRIGQVTRLYKGIDKVKKQKR